MNTDSVDLVIFKTGDEAAAHGPGGACWADDRSVLYVVLPGSKHLDAIKVSTDPEDLKRARVWQVSGSTKNPTLHPSLLVQGQWHGYLRGGRLVSC